MHHGAAHRPIPGGRQPGVCVIHRLLLNIQPQHAACGPGQLTQKLRVMAVPAGGIHIQSARGQPRRQKFVAELHGGQIRHAAAHQLGTIRGKIKLFCQCHASRIAGQGSREPRGLLGVKPTAAAQDFFQQIAAVAPPAPLRRNLKLPNCLTVQHCRADGLLLFI